MKMTLPLMDLEANVCGEKAMDASIFALTPDTGLLQLVSRWQSWNSHRAQETKRRGDINASGHKVGRQKGGGRARHGGRTANIFRGGAQAHGTSGDRHAFKINKKVRQLALRHALSSVYGEGNVILLKEASVPTHKTGALVSLLDGFARGRLLMVDTEWAVNFSRAASNIRRVTMLQIEAINVRALLLHKTLVITQEALKMLEGRLGAASSSSGKQEEAAS